MENSGISTRATYVLPSAVRNIKFCYVLLKVFLLGLEKGGGWICRVLIKFGDKCSVIEKSCDEDVSDT